MTGEEIVRQAWAWRAAHFCPKEDKEGGLPLGCSECAFEKTCEWAGGKDADTETSKP